MSLDSIKRSNKFTCMGWISKIGLPDYDPMILFAVSNKEGIVKSDTSIKIELKKYGDTDYKLQFSNSESKPVYSSTGISLNDNNWHLLTYICYGEGLMHYYIDGIECPAEDGNDISGMPYSVAWSRSSRLGGGKVWIPYLDREKQYINVYRWRYANNLILHKDWVNKLYSRELKLIQGV